jgi:hypothetical protein
LDGRAALPIRGGSAPIHVGEVVAYLVNQAKASQEIADFEHLNSQQQTASPA